MADTLNPVKPKVTVDGKAIEFESLRLEQKMNSTHSFEVVSEFMSQDELWKQKPDSLMEQVGSEVTIHFEHVDSGESYDFKGYVTDVQIGSWDTDPAYVDYGHQSNRVHLIGHGRVIKLDTVKGLDSYVDKTLKAIFDENSKYTSKAASSVVCNPNFTGSLPYVMRYNESLFQFFNRLSSIFGELFYYDGEKLNFGKPNDSGSEKLTLGNDLLGLRTIASAMPRNYSRYDFISKDDREVVSDSTPGSLPGLLGNAGRKNEMIYAASNADLTHSEYPIAQETQLKDLLKARQTTADGSLLRVEGISRTCKLKLGGVIEIAFPGDMGVSALGKFRVMEITHTVDKMGNYTNHFFASPSGKEPVSMEYADIKAFPEVATIKDNADPDKIGRVQVQFDWQKRCSKTTNWIRVQTPDAGGTGKKNRGMVFIPEKDDRVMVGFEYGDPNRPYVMGALFTGKNSQGGGDKNNLHTILTKSGREIILNDADDGGIIIKDANGSSIELNVKDKKITIIAPEDILLQSKNITFEAKENITVKAGKDYEKKIDGKSTVEIGKDSTRKVKGKYEETIEKDVTTTIKGKQETKISKDHTKKVSGKMELSVTKDCKADVKGKLTCEVMKDAKINSKSKGYFTALSNVYLGK